MDRPIFRDSFEDDYPDRATEMSLPDLRLAVVLCAFWGDVFGAVVDLNEPLTTMDVLRNRAFLKGLLWTKITPGSSYYRNPHPSASMLAHRLLRDTPDADYSYVEMAAR